MARSSQAVCESLVEETLELELRELAKDILDVELRRIRKFIKKYVVASSFVSILFRGCWRAVLSS